MNEPCPFPCTNKTEFGYCKTTACLYAPTIRVTSMPRTNYDRIISKTPEELTEATQMNKGMLTSNRQDWETPPELFNRLDAIFHFSLDACAVQCNAKCAKYFSPEEDGLTKSWGGEVVWCNPPYGRKIGAWIHKAYEESKRACVVMLLPARTDTAWFHDYCAKGQITFLRGRLKFGGSKNPAPFPSMIVVFDRRYQYGLPELGT